jgi:hypothetical protein
MRTGELAPMERAGGVVEADETSTGRAPGKPKKRPYNHKMKVLSLLYRARSRLARLFVDDLKRLLRRKWQVPNAKGGGDIRTLALRE